MSNGSRFLLGFGNTFGNQERYRIGRKVPLIKINIDMAINKISYFDAVCEKYNIHLKGSKIKINPNLVCAGKVVKIRPNIIELGPRAFINEIELANTIAHELNHARSYIKGGDAPHMHLAICWNAI